MGKLFMWCAYSIILLEARTDWTLLRKQDGQLTKAWHDYRKSPFSEKGKYLAWSLWMRLPFLEEHDRHWKLPFVSRSDRHASQLLNVTTVTSIQPFRVRRCAMTQVYNDSNNNDYFVVEWFFLDIWIAIENSEDNNNNNNNNIIIIIVKTARSTSWYSW